MSDHEILLMLKQLMNWVEYMWPMIIVEWTGRQECVLVEQAVS
jgi:hypothetical protein